MAYQKGVNPAVRDARPIPRIHPSGTVPLNTRPRQTEQSRPNAISMTISQEEFDSKYYKITKGRALVLNNKDFHVNGENLADRSGSDLDATTISQRFDELNEFDYDLESDLTRDETMTWLETEREKLKTDRVDCLVVVILSHGNEEGIYATDCLMKVTDLVNVFNATNCPQLMFKPKIFIIQACRGTDLSYGVNVQVDKNQADCKGDDTEYKQWLDMQTIRLPNEADFLFAYAAIPGTGAFRNVETGSPFIKHLSDAIEDMEVNEDFYSVLTRVNKMVGLTYQPKNHTMELNSVVQMPCFVSHLTKTLRLKQS